VRKSRKLGASKALLFYLRRLGYGPSFQHGRGTTSIT
jgi:hypothetical protein